MISNVHFHITGSLKGTVSGTGDQQQGEELVKDIPISGEIDVDLDYDFTLTDSAPSHIVSIDAVTTKDLLKNLNHDISSFESFNLNADFDPPVHTLNFELHPELSVQYAPFFGWYKPADQVQSGFGFLNFAFKIDNVNIEEPISFRVIRSTYNCGDLGYMGGFEITLLPFLPAP